MMGAVAGLASREGVSVDDVACADVSFPGFAARIDSLRSA
jgi:5-enolpyruvylshikimate-3-phosphate synthase